MNARIKIRLTEDRQGNVLLVPISAKARKAIRESNAYNNSSSVYVQTDVMETLRSVLPRSAFIGPREHGNYSGDWEFNNNAVFLMDSWTFRHMVGGQSD